MLEIPWVEPGRAFLALGAGDRALPGVAFLDSAGPLRDVSRWSVLAAEPFDTISLRAPGADPFAAIADALALHRRPAGAMPFAEGALLGYLGYGARHSTERLPRRLSDASEPDLWFGCYDALIIFDREHRRAWVASSGLPERGERAAAQRRRERASRLALRLASLPPEPSAAAGPARLTPLESGTAYSPALSPAMGSRRFGETVEQASAFIRAGDIYQVNLSYPVDAPCDLAPSQLYDRLRRLSPAPFGAYLDTGAFQVLCNSPERFLLLEDGRIETRPIKGTRPRSLDGVEDARQAAELLASPKDRAEHVMIVDLERNDLGRVAIPGSVRVERMAGLESYASVHHLVSVVSASARPGAGPSDVLRACFPGGSITGAPKIRAMEIIEALEVAPRGIYTGAIGGIGFSGRMDLAIAIRTAVLREGRARFHVGGGIVADSKPAEEYRETLTKAEAFARLLAS
ncbi:MAG: aminodeoxychorismate synthase component I [Deltaproteobacteria bacterium]|nr:aminodeoxychorismate synthase component I [Deltaproteobacteria bacterium]